MNQKTYIVYLHSLGFSQRKLRRIFHDSHNYKGVFENISYSTLKKMGFSDLQCEKILEKKSKIQTDYIDKKLLEYGVDIIVYGSPEYPKNLSQIENAPYVLYVRGKLENNHCLAVVGSRKISTYGKKVVSKILTDLSPYLTIVSGGAYGCDSEAHKVALSLGTPTIAVIGTGIDINYPVTNATLYNDIVAQ
jgi:DNA processing protein